MKLVGPEFLRAFGGRCVNTHPALLPAFPGMHGRATRWPTASRSPAPRCSSSTPASTPAPIVAQAAVPVEDDDDVELAARADQGRRARACSSTPSAGWPARAAPSPTGRSGSRDPGRTDRTRTIEPGPGDERRPVRRALVSVYDKTGLEELARGLHEAGVELVSTGSTGGRIADAGVPVTPVEELTGFPECLDGRVKTLHPRVHAGILADLRLEDHRRQLEELGIEPFDLVVVNLYPFAETVASGATPDECVEQIDIGGPVDGARGGEEPPLGRGRRPRRSATTTCWPPSRDGGFTLRRARAARGRGVRAHRDVRRGRGLLDGQRARRHRRRHRLPAVGRAHLGPRRRAALRREPAPAGRALPAAGGGGLAGAEQLHGKEMSYNNYVDTDAARRAAYDFDEPGRRGHQARQPVRHRGRRRRRRGAPQGARVRPGVGVRRRDRRQPAGERWRWPSRSPRSSPRWSWRRPSRTARGGPDPQEEHPAAALRPTTGARPGGVPRRSAAGCSMQARDRLPRPRATTPPTGRWRPATRADEATLADLAFAWRACRAVKSNAILLAADGASVGVGMGQVNRVDSCRLAVARAGERAAGSVAAQRRVLPVRRRPGGPRRGRGPGRRAARRVGPRRRGRRGRARRPA